jgi:hypothetical protein
MVTGIKMREAFWVYRWQTGCNHQDACSSYTSSRVLPTHCGNNVLCRWQTYDSHGILLVVSYTYVFEVSIPAEDPSQPNFPNDARSTHDSLSQFILHILLYGGQLIIKRQATHRRCCHALTIGQLIMVTHLLT